MKPPKYTEEDIIAAGKSLQARSKEVSPNAIKLQLGGGNPARIKKVWDEHAGDPESSEPRQSRLHSPLDPNDDFALEIDMPLRNASYKVEAVFQSLIDDLKISMQRKLDHLLDIRTRDLSLELGELTSELKHANRQIDHWKESREEISRSLMEKSKENKRLMTSVDSLSKQIDDLEKKQST